MALSIAELELRTAELELRTAEFLPAREVMSTCGGKLPKNDCCGDHWHDESDDDTQYNSSKGFIAVTALNFNDTDVELGLVH